MVNLEIWASVGVLEEKMSGSNRQKLGGFKDIDKKIKSKTHTLYARIKGITISVSWSLHPINKL